MAEEKKMEKKERKSVIDLFMKGCYDGFNIGIKNIMPAMILGYTLVYILQATGLMDLMGKVLSPVMGVFGLPGEAFAVLISAFFAKAAGAASGANMYASGILTVGQASMMLPACMLMGTLIGHYARIVLVSGVNHKWHGLLIAIPLFDAALSLWIMKIIFSFMGIQ
jgi:spore maturation protein SpmB